MIFLTFLSFCVKIRKCKIIRVKRLSVANRWHCHPEGSTIAFHRVHKHGYHSHKPCSNDNSIFLLDYSYYNVYEAGCRWFFDHHWLIFTQTYRPICLLKKAKNFPYLWKNILRGISLSKDNLPPFSNLSHNKVYYNKMHRFL